MTEGSGVGPDARSDGDDQTAWARLVRAAVPGPVRRRYAAKLAVGFALVVLLIAAVGGASYVQTRAIIEGDAEDTLRSTATVQADSVSEWLVGMRSHTRGLASADVYATGDRERIRQFLSSSRQVGDADVAGLHYVDPDSGEVVASTDVGYEGQRVASVAPAWQGPIDAATNPDGPPPIGMSDAAYERNGRLLIAFASEVRVGEGVLVVVGDVRRDFEQLHGSRPVATTRLLNAAGRDVFDSRRGGPSELANTSAFAAARNGTVTVHERSSDVVAFAPVEGVDWVVATAAPKSELYAASETVGRNVVVLAAAAVAILGGVGAVLGLGTVRSLDRLRRRAEAMEAGDLDVDFRTNREDEIGRLFDAFAGMRDALRDQIREAEVARERAEASREELERQNERLDQFASTVSHDLRNPLTVANGHLELLAAAIDERDDLDGDDVELHVEKIEDATGRMEDIIDDVLALARDGAVVDETRPVELEVIAREAWANVDGAPDGDPEQSATLRVTGSRSLDADPDRLLRAFENLFRNSVEHGSTSSRTGSDDAVEHGSVDSRTVTVEVGPTDDGFYVADDGPGIPADAVDDVFEYGHTTAEDGTGFGLAIVQTVVTAHGWEVAVDADYDGGAKFVVSGVDGE